MSSRVSTGHCLQYNRLSESVMNQFDRGQPVLVACVVMDSLPGSAAGGFRLDRPLHRKNNGDKLMVNGKTRMQNAAKRRGRAFHSAGNREGLLVSDSRAESDFLRAAVEEALRSYHEGGLPIGAVMVENGVVIAAGHNRRVQDSDPIAHGEMDCFRKAGRRSRYDGITLYTTLSPCMMCSGTIVQFGVKTVVVGEDKNFPGNIDFLRSHGVEVRLLNDADCISLMERFIKERPDLWDEDIAGRSDV